VSGAIRLTVSHKAQPRGRPIEQLSKRTLAKMAGVDRQTLRRARAHVAACDRYPEFQVIGQGAALKAAVDLDAMEEAVRTLVRAWLPAVLERKIKVDRTEVLLIALQEEVTRQLGEAPT
jgi:hypothetical protein